MATPVFPLNLPGVSSLSWEAEPQVLATEAESGPRAYRSITRVPAARASVSWRFLGEDFAVFKAFWKTDLIRGHKWFHLVLPSAAGYAVHTVRFITHHVSRADGYGYRTVDAQLYIRERRLRPDVAYMYITSTLYPVDVQDALDIRSTVISGQLGQNFGYADDALDIAATLVSGSLPTALVSYGYHASDTDRVDAAATLVSGTLQSVLVTHAQPNEDEISVSSTVLSGTLALALVSNSMQPEALDINATVVSGTLE